MREILFRACDKEEGILFEEDKLDILTITKED